jgi:hypothetical protein
MDDGRPTGSSADYRRGAIELVESLLILLQRATDDVLVVAYARYGRCGSGRAR